MVLLPWNTAVDIWGKIIQNTNLKIFLYVALKLKKKNQQQSIFYLESKKSKQNLIEMKEELTVKLYQIM